MNINAYHPNLISTYMSSSPKYATVSSGKNIRRLSLLVVGKVEVLDPWSIDLEDLTTNRISLLVSKQLDATQATTVDNHVRSEVVVDEVSEIGDFGDFDDATKG